MRLILATLVLVFAVTCSVANALRPEEHRRTARPRDFSKMVRPDRSLAAAKKTLRSGEKSATQTTYPLKSNKQLKDYADICGIENVVGDNLEQGRIVGGHEAKKHQFPWTVAVVVDGFIFCGGSIISEEWVMTAAHCAEGAMYVDITAGAHNIYSGTVNNEPGRVEMTSYETVTHPSFSFPNYDMTLVKLPKPLIFSDTIRPICLPPYSEADMDFLGEEMTAIGWGYTDASITLISDPLMYVDKLPVISDQTCRDLYNQDLGETFICVDSTFSESGEGGHGTCQGDSGGPLVRNIGNNKWEQLGVVSFGSGNCEEGAPDGFSKVPLFLPWISQVTGIEITP